MFDSSETEKTVWGGCFPQNWNGDQIWRDLSRYIALRINLLLIKCSTQINLHMKLFRKKTLMFHITTEIKSREISANIALCMQLLSHQRISISLHQILRFAPVDVISESCVSVSCSQSLDVSLQRNSFKIA